MRSLAVLALGAGVSRAQTVPRLTGEIVMGSGPGTTRVGEAYFAKQSGDRTIYGAGALRLGGPGRVRAVIVGELHNGPGDDVALCGLAPNGTCYRRLVLPYGFAAGVGARAALFSRVMIGAYGGLGHTDVNAPFIATDVAIEVLERVSVVATMRHSVWKDAQQLKMWYRPIGFGLRVR